MHWKHLKKNKPIQKLLFSAVLLLAAVAVWKLAAGSGPGRMKAGTKGQTAAPVFIESCLIDDGAGEVVVRAFAESIPDSDDDYYYLFALRPYEEEIGGDKTFMLRERKKEEMEFRFGFHSGMRSELYSGTEMFDKYVIAVKAGEGYTAVSNPHYITNPEAVAVFLSNGERPSGKKGLLIDPDKLLSSELEELGVKHAAYNIPVSRILGHDREDIYEAVHYTYNGKDYVFNGRVMSEYDLIFRTLTDRGIEITAIILNDVSEDYPWMIHPLARSGVGKPPYYAFNAGEEQGVEYLAAIGSFLAQRYSGAMNGRGMVANWVIGNEINARKEWNYMEHVELETYVQEYARAYRVFYNAIKSVNSACRVYISLDNQWNRVNILTRSYKAREVLDEFNRQIRAEGNIDWGLAIHPYNKPLSRSATWKSSIYVNRTEDTPVVTMANLHVVTDYMRQEEFLDDEGKVRAISVTELGYTSSKGEELQAAAIVYAYRMAEANPYIDAVLFSRQTDAGDEIKKLKLYLGLDCVDGAHKYAYDVYKYMDTEKAEEYTEFAKDIIGIGDWEEIRPDDSHFPAKFITVQPSTSVSQAGRTVTKVFFPLKNLLPKEPIRCYTFFIVRKKAVDDVW